MRIETRDIATLVEDPANVRTHGPRNLEAVKGSLAKFGQQKPIVVDSKGVVLAGNATLRAARELGWKQLAVAVTDLAGVEAILFSIADNKTAELAEWDFEALAEIFRSTPEELREFSGFAPFEIEPLLQADWTPPEVSPSHDKEKDTRTVTFEPEEWKVVATAIEVIRADGKMDDDESRSEAITEMARRFLETVER